jgi:hypothetical protein
LTIHEITRYRLHCGNASRGCTARYERTTTSRLLKKSAKGAVFDDFWEVSQKSDRKPPLKTLAFWIRCGGIHPLRPGQKSYFNNLLVFRPINSFT